MNFNKIWTKEKNDQLRQMIKDEKSVQERIDFFGEDLKHHPKNKYSGGKKILPFIDYNKLLQEEIKITPEKISYHVVNMDSLMDKNKLDYIAYFKLEHNYVLVFSYYKVGKIESYNMLYKTDYAYNLYLEEMSKIKSLIEYNKNFERLREIIERETDYKELYDLLKSVSYIILDFYPKISNLPLSIGTTKNKVKINLYRNILKDSFPEIIETIGKDNDGDPIYYFELKNKN